MKTGCIATVDWEFGSSGNGYVTERFFPSKDKAVKWVVKKQRKILQEALDRQVPVRVKYGLDWRVHYDEDDF